MLMFYMSNRVSQSEQVALVLFDTFSGLMNNVVSEALKKNKIL